MSALTSNVPRMANSGSAVYSMNATTYDNIFSIQFQSASAVQKNEDDVLIAPSTTKISVNIKDYPFKSNRSKLALEVLLLNANFGSEISPEYVKLPSIFSSMGGE